MDKPKEVAKLRRRKRRRNHEKNKRISIGNIARMGTGSRSDTGWMGDSMDIDECRKCGKRRRCPDTNKARRTKCRDYEEA